MTLQSPDMADTLPTIPITRDTAALIMSAIEVAYDEGQLAGDPTEIIRALYAAYPDVGIPLSLVNLIGNATPQNPPATPAPR